MDELLRIRLLGSLDLRLGDDPLPPLESARAASLLAYLLLHRDAPQPRQQLAFLLWPDSSEAQARTNLRHVLHTLRRALPAVARYLAVTPTTLHWRGDAPAWLDVAAFDAAVTRAETAAPEVAKAWQEAIDLYRGDLLEGVYDDWLIGERDRYRQRYGQALEQLVALLERAGEAERAIAAAERLLRHDPLHEGAYRALMRLHDGHGERARALRVYHVCAATLERELGVEPSPETRALYDALVSPVFATAPPATAPPGAPARRGRPIPFVGRAGEWRRLADLWQTAMAGESQVVLVSGEAGIGKTRLVEEFRVKVAARGVATARARAYPAEGQLAYGPLAALLRAEALAPHLAGLDRAHLAELTRLLPELPRAHPELTARWPRSTGDQRQRLFDAAVAAILTPTEPLLLVVDDLQWCDQETLHFLHYLLRSVPHAPLLLVATARPEELAFELEPRSPLAELLAGLRALECLTELPLGRLSAEDVADLAAGLTGAPLSAAESHGLFDETEGNPLFVIEALRAGWTSEVGARGWVTPRVQAVIESRLARLSVPARELVGLAATVGREFTADVLAEVASLDEAALVRGLDELWRRRILREQGIDAYDFSHDLIREVAYRALGPAQRRHHHLQVARALERLHEDDPAAVGGQVAAHYDRAGAIEQAIAWYQRAAEAALHLFANLEAARLLERGLELLRALPRTPERTAREGALLAALLAPLGVAEGFASPRLAEAHRRALALATDPTGELPAPLLRSLSIVSLSQGDIAAAQQFGAQLRARGEALADDVLLVESAYLLGIAAFWQGQLPGARLHFEEAVARYRPETAQAHRLQYGLDPKVICLSRLANTLWLLGLPAEAHTARDEALALAEASAHPYSQATAGVFAALLALDMGDLAGLRDYASRVTPGQREREGRPTEIMSEALSAYLDVVDGHVQTGLARLEHLLDEPGRVDHAPGMRAALARTLVAACAAADDPHAGLAATERALAMGEVRLWEAETRRLRAEFLAALGRPWEDISAEFERALLVARQQGAAAFETRILASQQRLRTGKPNRV